MDHPDRKLIRKIHLNNSLDQRDLTDIYRAFHPAAAGYMFFLSTGETVCRTDHRLGCKTSLNNSKKIEIISGFFSKHESTKLETSCKYQLGYLQICED